MKTILTLFATAALALAERTVILSWDPNHASEQVTSYEVFRDGEQVAVVTDGVSTELKIPDGPCTITVVACNMASKSPPSVPLVIPATPTAPKGVKIKINIEVTVSE